MSDRVDTVHGVAVMGTAVMGMTAVNGRAAAPVPPWGSSAYHRQPITDSSVLLFGACLRSERSAARDANVRRSIRPRWPAGRQPLFSVAAASTC